MNRIKVVKCPTCQKEVSWEPASQWRPFCSERCQMIDLHGWFTEQHRIPGEPVPGECGEINFTGSSSTDTLPDDETQF